MNSIALKPLFFFVISKFFYNNEKNYFENDQLSSSSVVENIIQEGEVTFKKNPTVALPGVSKVTDSVISKRQGDQRKPSSLERTKNCIKGKMDSI